MAEPKKETVRIVLPPRKDNQPATANPRESAMLNLPPKPAPIVPGGTPPSGSSLPKPPAPPAPPSPGTSLPKPPAPPASSITPPKSPSAPSAPSAPEPVKQAPPAAPASSIGPAPLKPAPKKETAKVPPSSTSAKPLPQATVQLQKPTPPKSVMGASKISIAPGPIGGQKPESPVLAIAALVAALLALGVQLWIYTSV